MNAVSGSVSQWLLDVAGEAEFSLDRFARRVPVDLNQLSDPDRYVDWDVFVSLCESIDDLFADSKLLTDRARNSLARRFEREGAALDLPIRDERQLYWIAQRWVGPTLFPSLSFEFTTLSSGDLKLTAEIPADARECKQLFPLLSCALAVLPRLIDREEATVSLDVDGRHAAFHISAAGPAEEISEQRARSVTQEGSRDDASLSSPAGRKRAQAVIVDLDAIVSNVDRRIRRLIREDIELVTSLDSAVERVRIDRTQIEQVILNLAVTVRDAMPQVGHLSITTRPVEVDPASALAQSGIPVGPYVSLEVRDTGVRSVEQSGGRVRLDSEVGVFTRFALYFPVVDASDEEIAPAVLRVESGTDSPRS